MEYVTLFAVVLLLNALPAFAPPTWSVLVLYRLNFDMSPVGIVVVGAISAATGRWLLATYTRALATHLSQRRRANLEAAGTVLLRRGTRSVVGIALFALSPLPSAQLFEAAGLMKVRLLQLVVAFFAGRIVTYSIYVTGASAAKHSSWGSALQGSFSSPWNIALQVALIAALYGLSKIDWTKRAKAIVSS